MKKPSFRDEWKTCRTCHCPEKPLQSLPNDVETHGFPSWWRWHVLPGYMAGGILHCVWLGHAALERATSGACLGFSLLNGQLCSLEMVLWPPGRASAEFQAQWAQRLPDKWMILQLFGKGASNLRFLSHLVTVVWNSFYQGKKSSKVVKF